MRIACYNVENLFDRAKVMNLPGWSQSKPVLDAFAALNALLAKPAYGAADKRRMVELFAELGLTKDDTGPFVILRRNRGALVRRPRGGGPIEIVASGRSDWTGSLELIEEPIRQAAIDNTARVIAEIGADVIGVVEAESRPALDAFNQTVITAVGGRAYEQVMVIDGNDKRGIDVGLMTKRGFAIGNMRSHVDDRENGGLVFSRDCPEYEITVTASGARLVVLVNHLKSKGFGKPAESDAKRETQAKRIAAIYRGLVASGVENIVVLGDLNDTPDSAPLAPLLGGTDLRDVSALPDFDNGGFPGTFGSSGERNKIDYILMSPALFRRARRGGIFRKGMWPGVRPRKWDVFPELVKEADAASDHAALFVDIDI